MKKILILFSISILFTVLAACGDSEDTGSKQSAEAEKISIKHELDTTDVPVNPEKVVVFDFGTLDSLDKLGINVLGVPQGGSIPEYLSKYESNDYENVGSLKEPDFDKLAEIDPDLIIISGRQAELYDQLSELAPTIYLGVDTTRYMDSFKENLDIIGKIWDKEDEVQTQLAAIEDSIASLQEKAKASDVNGLIILANDDKISAYGANSRFGLIHDVFGIKPVDENIEASTHGMNVSFEYVVEKDPDMLYVIDRSAAVEGNSTAKQLVENKLVENTKAYQNDNIVYLNPDFWYLSGGGLVSVEEMVNEISDSLE
ncbi:siderophore ABC transporter substrate-binding protein [Ornithinibacillus sp. BX22]|uniref:Siderophore ABC transporter substrate-binding protein n=2 Tax=Ornithinibacillus TaxID=484508 RepID=A0A923RI09_9BACI|nr:MULTISPECIES: siderophore ABC transporter substrate-binding protein [Ornithinibacillus]MBC5636905.1 siderophore ABC transporter substrate-binding protein [Ornithinibacillus hominis]MBS3681470.1 siderophore ABC transporter substrate-binding protein [Ornithinibacillus massiliensis]